MAAGSRRWLAPEVVQTSAMDCGPATLKCLLEGHGISVSYGRLREACQTDVDGTSIDTMEEVANQLGLEAEQVLLPAEHILLPEAQALPAIVVVRLANGITHFVVVWRELAGLVQVMDPGQGRRFLSRERFLSELYEHEMEFPAAAWREWAGSPDAKASFECRLREIGFGRGEATRRVTAACGDATWRSLGALDAAMRAVASLRSARAIARRHSARKLLDELLEDAAAGENRPTDVIPEPFWSVRPAPRGTERSGLSDDDEKLLLRGAVLVRVQGKGKEKAPGPEELSPELQAALLEKPPRPAAELWNRLCSDGIFAPASLVAALLGAAFVLALEALLFRGVLELAPFLSFSGQRLGALGAVILFMLLVLGLELSIARSALRLGRKLEARLRLAFQTKIPLLSDRYFASRLTSDMADRLHKIHAIRQLSPLGGRLLRSSFELVLTAAALAWLKPAAAPLAFAAATLSLVLPLCALPHLLEKDLRVRSHAAGLSRFYLDALLGLVPLRLHGAARALRGEHEALLVEWARARLGLQWSVVWVTGSQFALGFGLATWLLLGHVDGGGALGVVLLLAYWALNLPVLGLEVVELAWRYPEHRNVMLRALEPLSAPEEETGARSERDPRSESSSSSPRPLGVRLELSGVQVRAGGHEILSGIDLNVAPGSHVAVVGPSGAGKSTLLGLFLGWSRPSAGSLRVDGEPLDGPRLARLRGDIAWVDPSVQLWNRSFLDNLCYGGGELSERALAQAMALADLKPVLELLPDGHQTPLGEGGGLVSGGEGQRVRLARALLRERARLVLLDEPFRGVDRSARLEFLSRARRFWKDATMLCVSHDVEQTLDFDQVIVIDQGGIVEMGTPAELAGMACSRYRALLEADRRARELFLDATWRRLHLESGRLGSGGCR